MKTIIPDYYHNFKCIADQCQHTCCAGWEIDVDEETLEIYKKAEGEFGQKLRNHIVEDECPHFRLTRDERCPFLNEQNLCEIIIHYGENALCQICSDHPRFVNVLQGREEKGVGLCCEEAARLILSNKNKVCFLEESDGQEEEPKNLDKCIIDIRKEAIRIIQNREMSIEERVETLVDRFQIEIPSMTYSQWADFYFSLERLDHNWNELLVKLKEKGDFVQDEGLDGLETAFEQLVVYFLYRHLPLSWDETDIYANIGFAMISYKIIRKICCIQDVETSCKENDLIDLARIYSAEIEYSEENTDKILEIFY